MRRLLSICLTLSLAPGTALAADSPDDAVATLVSSYEARNLVAYDGLLSDEFIFFFSSEDVNAGLPSLYGRVEELSVTEQMFTGQPGQSPQGDPLPAVAGFQLALAPVDAWSSNVAPEFAGTQKRTYDTDLVVSFVDGSIATVRGLQEFYVREVSPGVFQLEFWRDLGVPLKAATESSSWGALKAGAFQPVPTAAESMSAVKSRF